MNKETPAEANERRVKLYVDLVARHGAEQVIRYLLLTIAELRDAPRRAATSPAQVAP